MIIEVRQTKADIRFKYDIYYDNYFKYSAHISPFSKFFKCYIKDIDDNIQIYTKYDFLNQILSITSLEFLYKKPRVRLLCKVYDTECIGSFQLSRYGYRKSMYELKIRDKTFYGYRVSEGSYNYVAIYDNDKQFVLIEKSLNVINGNDIYMIYLLDTYKEYDKFISMFTVYYDNWVYTTRGSFYYGEVRTKEWTISDYNKKYDPEWKLINFKTK